MTKSEIQLIRSLSDKRARTDTGLFVAEGCKLISEIIDSGLEVEAIYSSDGSFAERAETVAPSVMERISQLKTASSSVAVVRQPHYRTPATAPADKLSIALDAVQNPGNMGTIIRLADWFGIEDIFCSEATADCFNPKVVQASMGAILRVKVHYLALPAFLARSAEAGVNIYGTALDGGSVYDKRLTPTGVIVMGNEGRGLSEECRRHLTDTLFIPSYPPERLGSESLNVAMATGIICAEFRRRTAAALSAE